MDNGSKQLLFIKAGILSNINSYEVREPIEIRIDPEKIIKSTDANNFPHPIFDTDNDKSYFMVELIVNSYFNDKDKNQDKVQDKDQDDLYLKELEVEEEEKNGKS